MDSEEKKLPKDLKDKHKPPVLTFFQLKQFMIYFVMTSNLFSSQTVSNSAKDLEAESSEH